MFLPHFAFNIIRILESEYFKLISTQLKCMFGLGCSGSAYASGSMEWALDRREILLVEWYILRLRLVLVVSVQKHMSTYMISKCASSLG